MHLYLEFHCTSQDNERAIASGHNDPDLSPAGERQAADLGDRYRNRDIAMVYASDLTRARRTAEIAFGARGVPITLDARLRECNYGELNGSPRKELRANSLRFVAEKYPAGESWAGAAMRVLKMFHEVRKQHPGTEKVVIIGHSATYYALESHVSGKKLADLIAQPWEWTETWRWEANLA